MSFLNALITDDLDNISDLGTVMPYSSSGLGLVVGAPPGFTGGNRAYITCSQYEDSINMSVGEQAGNTLYIAGFVKTPTANSSGTQAMVGIGGPMGGSYGYPRTQCGLVWSTTLAKFGASRGVSSVAWGATTFNRNTWYSIRIECKVHSSTGVFKLWVDGSLEINFSGNTQAFGYDNVNYVNLGSFFAENGYPSLLTGLSGAYQFIVCNNQGSVNNSMIPWSMGHELLYPESDGASTWTPSAGAAYAAIDELVGAYNDDTDYVSATALNAKQIAGLPNPTGTIGNVMGVIVNGRLKRTNIGVVGVKIGTKVSTDERQSPAIYLSTAYKNYQYLTETKDGTNLFTQSDLNSLEITAEVTDLP